MTRYWLICILGLAAATAVLADAPEVLVRDGRSFVPVRYVSESLGAQVSFDKVTLSITINRGSEVVWLKQKSKHAKAKGRPFVLDSPSFVYLNVTYVPLRFVASSLGAQVTWQSGSREVTIIDASRGKTLKLHANNGRGPVAVPPGHAKGNGPATGRGPGDAHDDHHKAEKRKVGKQTK